MAIPWAAHVHTQWFIFASCNKHAKTMQKSVLQTRINEARNLSHKESREKILSSIRSELQPIIDQMDTAIGRKAQQMYADPSISPYSFDDDGNPDSSILISYENGFTGEAVHINTAVVDDVHGLVRVRELIAELKLGEAYEKAQHLDTAVREYIPDDVWDFFRS
jgi:hypothetical protein